MTDTAIRDELLRNFFQVRPDPYGYGWSWSLQGEVWGDGFDTEADAWSAANDEYQSRRAELCERCGNQYVCPECVGA